MVSTTFLIGGALALYTIFSLANGLRTNIGAARKTGLPFLVVPASPFNRFWQVTFWIWTPLIELLPRRFWQDWLFVLQADWSYRNLQEPYDRLGDTFLVVSPKHIIMWTQNAGAIRQITTRREDFPKALENYEILAIFGKNVLTTEGQLWRFHRKATSASFNEKNAAHTFSEAIYQTQGMITKWLDNDGKQSQTIRTIEQDTMTLALNIIGSVGFGLRFLWPGQTLPENTDPKLRKYGSLDPPPGHSMTFPKALATLLEHILVLLLVPGWMLRILPFRAAKRACEARKNYEAYMHEFLAEKTDEVRKGDRAERGMDVMGQLVRIAHSDKTAATGGQQQLEDSDIIGNAFVITVAGHETTANTLHFTLLELATNPAAQRALQADIDRLFGASDPAGWNYEQNVNAMLASQLGAAMNETLRLMPAVVEIPKHVKPAQAQVLVIDGQKHVLPPKMSIAISAVAVHRNPRYWPSRPSKLTGEATDLNDFLPERWFRPSIEALESRSANKEGGEVDEAADAEDYGGFRGPDTSAQLFRPERGSFIPFSEGARSCLGRRIAQVEMIAALAVIFQGYSLELAVDEWATDEEVEGMSRVERAKVYQKAQHKCRNIIKGAESLLTLKLHGQAYVPVRLVKRAEERFVSFMDPS